MSNFCCFSTTQKKIQISDLADPTIHGIIVAFAAKGVHCDVPFKKHFKRTTKSPANACMHIGCVQSCEWIDLCIVSFIAYISEESLIHNREHISSTGDNNTLRQSDAMTPMAVSFLVWLIRTVWILLCRVKIKSGQILLVINDNWWSRM